MATGTQPIEIDVTLRHIEPATPVKEYAPKKLGRALRPLRSLMGASVEIDFQQTRPANQRYVVQATLLMDGDMLRVEDRGPDAKVAIDQSTTC